MPKLPAIRPRVVIQFLERHGFILDHTSGSHFIFIILTHDGARLCPGTIGTCPKVRFSRCCGRRDLVEATWFVSYKAKSRRGYHALPDSRGAIRWPRARGR